MEDSLLYAEVERRDAEMAAVPLVLRQLDVYHALIGREERDEESLAFLEKISAWYKQRYGPEAAWNGVLSRDPIILRGKLQVMEIIHSTVKPRSGLEIFLEQLTQEGKPASPEECRYLAVNSLESSGDFSALHNLEMAPSLLTAEQRALCRRAWFDLRNVTSVLEGSSDVQSAIVHAHEAAEKYLKVALLHEGLPAKSLGKGKYGHDLNKLISELSARHQKYGYLQKPAHELHSLFSSMNARYTTLKRSIKDAVQAFRLARHCCGFVAQQIELDKLRGSRDVDFVLGRFYQDSAGRQFRFCGFKQDQDKSLACMHLLEATDRGQTIDLLANFLLPCSFHYRLITDVQDIRRLEKRYAQIALQDRQRRQNVQGRPEVSIEHIRESFDGIISIRTPIK
jgi:HEPN domain-containing protein